jgi:hypothetical protein
VLILGVVTLGISRELLGYPLGVSPRGFSQRFPQRFPQRSPQRLMDLGEVFVDFFRDNSGDVPCHVAVGVQMLTFYYYEISTPQKVTKAPGSGDNPRGFSWGDLWGDPGGPLGGPLGGISRGFQRGNFCDFLFCIFDCFLPGTPGSVQQLNFADSYSFFEPVPNLPLNLCVD